MVRLVLLDLPDPLDLLEREESKDSLDLLVSRVCPDLLDLPERVASLETREFLVRLELLVLPDPEVSVVSLVRGAELDLRVCRDLVVFLERPELMDLRVPSGLLVLPEPKDLLVCRECLAREGLAESLELRETEVTTVRRDPREHQERMVVEV